MITDKDLTIISVVFSPWVPPSLKLGNEGHLGDFIEGLGPSQMVGRQVLGTKHQYGKCNIYQYDVTHIRKT